MFGSSRRATTGSRASSRSMSNLFTSSTTEHPSSPPRSPQLSPQHAEQDGSPIRPRLSLSLSLSRLFGLSPTRLSSESTVPEETQEEEEVVVVHTEEKRLKNKVVELEEQNEELHSELFSLQVELRKAREKTSVFQAQLAYSQEALSACTSREEDRERKIQQDLRDREEMRRKREWTVNRPSLSSRVKALEERCKAHVE